jgi:hypothetical protein
MPNRTVAYGPVVPYENVVASEETAAAGSGQPASPPPTFAAATTADGLMDRRNVVTDTAQGKALLHSGRRISAHP